MLGEAALRAVALELTQTLADASVQKVYVPQLSTAVLEVRTPGHSDLLVLSIDPAAAGLWVPDERPPSPAQAHGFQQLLRRELASARFAKAELLAPKVFALTLHRPKGGVQLIGEVGGPLVLVSSESQQVLATSGRREGLKVGQPYQLPRSGPAPEVPPAPPDPSSRLALSRAAYAQSRGEVQQSAQTRSDIDTQRALKKLRRTLEKVRAEAARGAVAEQYQRDGELLARNLHLVPKGAKTVRLTDYRADGEILERDVPLDVRKSPKAQVDWLFHQGKRLQRGVAVAAQRVAQLEAEEAALLRGDAPLGDAPAARGPGRAGESPSLPYRAYAGWNERRILVGRGSKANDELSFKVAAPHHVWLHARGVHGAHVVVPLQKGEVLPQELLIDAAHLALHHSGLKGEDKGEVTYTHAKYLRKVKGVAGAVTYSHDKTFWLRVEPERLARLLATAM